MFNAFDDNLSGDINFVEFLTAISLSGKASADEKLHLAFKMYDTNRNGHLENYEISQILGK
jgi:Ca2+-binding EF-hand superfamily protein